MRNKTKLYAIALVSLIIITAFTFDKRHQENKEQLKVDYSITNTWELPAELNEVSGISWVADDLIACVQDEQGTIFIYDLKQKKIVKEISFAGAGDYEGIAVVGKDAYVMRSDGLLYHVKNYLNSNKKVSASQTRFVAKNNMESLFFDQKNNSLLSIPKERDEDDQYKNIYQIALNTEKAETKIFTKISMEAALFKSFKDKKVYKTLNPSEIAINPKTNDVFVLEGKRPKLLTLGINGQLKKLYMLDKAIFTQPEGLTFSPDGRMFISNEAGKNSKANILEVVLQN
ncbi:SdiA-regulated domain-containing protein [Pedobacter arcticus]|uniref:SdiA-regulated domain-containing protein n=1 Tax=Pedobacter arcticus TaxID=752140 RepID=UPI0003197DE9|nr:SdiA-regulated domain-containing protein [Pedobacter arcticus]